MWKNKKFGYALRYRPFSMRGRDRRNEASHPQLSKHFDLSGFLTIIQLSMWKNYGMGFVCEHCSFSLGEGPKDSFGEVEDEVLKPHPRSLSQGGGGRALEFISPLQLSIFGSRIVVHHCSLVYVEV
jgi:hypothetical protein